MVPVGTTRPPTTGSELPQSCALPGSSPIYSPFFLPLSLVGFYICVCPSGIADSFLYQYAIRLNRYRGIISILGPPTDLSHSDVYFPFFTFYFFPLSFFDIKQPMKLPTIRESFRQSSRAVGGRQHSTTFSHIFLYFSNTIKNSFINFPQSCCKAFNP